MRYRISPITTVLCFLIFAQNLKATQFEITNETLHNAHVELIQTCTVTYNFNHQPKITTNAEIDLAPTASSGVFNILSGAKLLGSTACGTNTNFASINIYVKDNKGNKHQGGVVWAMNPVFKTEPKLYVYNPSRFLSVDYDKENKVQRLKLSFN